MTKEDTANKIKKMLEDEGIESMVVFAVGESHEEVISIMEGKGTRIMACIGMLIKMLSEEIDERSDHVARAIADNLEKAEEAFEKHMKEKGKDKTKDINKKVIKITVE